jgi:hypothetical protein
MLAEEDLLDVDPFDGLCVGSPASPVASASLPTGRWGLLRADVHPDGVALAGPDGLVFRAHGSTGRFRSVTLEPDALSLSLPASAALMTFEVTWPVRAATLDGVPVETSASGVWIAPEDAAGRRLRMQRG